MTDDKIFYLIKDFGFPIVMCIWFMVVTDKTIRKNTDALIKLKTTIEIMAKK